MSIVDAKKRFDTKAMILDSAEELMAEHGVSGISLRAILLKAGANTAALHYHFGSREAVVAAILARRGRRQTLRRLEMLTELEAKSESPSVLDVIDVIVDPFVEMLYEDGEQGRQFIRFLARLQADRARILAEEEKNHFPELRDRLGKLVTLACPHLPEAGLRRRLTMVLDTTLLSLASADVMVEEWDSDEHTAALLEYVVTLKRFLVGGLSASKT
jgi:AcrR family transcriptional regulator